MGFDAVEMAASLTNVSFAGDELTAALEAGGYFGHHPLGPIFIKDFLGSADSALRAGNVLVGAYVYSRPLADDSERELGRGDLARDIALMMLKIPSDQESTNCTVRLGSILQLKGEYGGELWYVNGYNITTAAEATVHIQSCKKAGRTAVLSLDGLAQVGTEHEYELAECSHCVGVGPGTYGDMMARCDCAGCGGMLDSWRRTDGQAGATEISLVHEHCWATACNSPVHGALISLLAMDRLRTVVACRQGLVDDDSVDAESLDKDGMLADIKSFILTYAVESGLRCKQHSQFSDLFADAADQWLERHRVDESDGAPAVEEGPEIGEGGSESLPVTAIMSRREEEGVVMVHVVLGTGSRSIRQMIPESELTISDPQTGARIFAPVYQRWLDEEEAFATGGASSLCQYVDLRHWQACPMGGIVTGIAGYDALELVQLLGDGMINWEEHSNYDHGSEDANSVERPGFIICDSSDAMLNGAVVLDCWFGEPDDASIPLPYPEEETCAATARERLLGLSTGSSVTRVWPSTRSADSIDAYGLVQQVLARHAATPATRLWESNGPSHTLAPRTLMLRLQPGWDDTRVPACMGDLIRPLDNRVVTKVVLRTLNSSSVPKKSERITAAAATPQTTKPSAASHAAQEDNTPVAKSLPENLNPLERAKRRRRSRFERSAPPSNHAERVAEKKVQGDAIATVLANKRSPSESKATTGATSQPTIGQGADPMWLDFATSMPSNFSLRLMRHGKSSTELPNLQKWIDGPCKDQCKLLHEASVLLKRGPEAIPTKQRADVEPLNMFQPESTAEYDADAGRTAVAAQQKKMKSARRQMTVATAEVVVAENALIEAQSGGQETSGNDSQQIEFYRVDLISRRHKKGIAIAAYERERRRLSSVMENAGRSEGTVSAGAPASELTASNANVSGGVEEDVSDNNDLHDASGDNESEHESDDENEQQGDGSNVDNFVSSTTDPQFSVGGHEEGHEVDDHWLGVLASLAESAEVLATSAAARL
jgi:hypothetical protein